MGCTFWLFEEIMRMEAVNFGKRKVGIENDELYIFRFIGQF
jgi:hypothetical protein